MNRAVVGAGVWALAVLVLTLMPASDVPGWPWAGAIHLDKIVHVFLFGVQCVLLGLALGRGRPAGAAAGMLALAALLAVAYGGVIELLQEAMGAGRHGDWADLAADAAGALLGAGLLYLRR